MFQVREPWNEQVLQLSVFLNNFRHFKFGSKKSYVALTANNEQKTFVFCYQKDTFNSFLSWVLSSSFTK